MRLIKMFINKHLNIIILRYEMLSSGRFWYLIYASIWTTEEGKEEIDTPKTIYIHVRCAILSPTELIQSATQNLWQHSW